MTYFFSNGPAEICARSGWVQRERPVSSLCRESESAGGRDYCSFYLLGCLASFPAKAVASAILQVLSPPPSAATQAAMTNSKRSRRRVQAKQGEVLTSSEVLKRLQEEKERRECSKRQRRKWAVWGLEELGQVVVSEVVGCGTSVFELKKRSHCDLFWGGGGGWAVRKRNRSCHIALIGKCWCSYTVQRLTSMLVRNNVWSDRISCTFVVPWTKKVIVSKTFHF